MLRRNLALCAALFAALACAPEARSTPDASAAPGTAAPWVSGYYAGWYWDTYPASAVDMTTMTHFIFGRYAPGAGTLGGSAGQLMPGAGTGHGANVEDALVAKAHTAGIKALAMLGGAGDGPGWVASTTPAVRATFIRNILDKCVAENYDGVDVDWEENFETSTERSQILSFLGELRTAAAERPRYQAPNAPFVITWVAFTVNTNTDLPLPTWHGSVGALVDQFNLMSYSMTWDCCGWETWLWAPITGEGGTHPTSIASSVNAYVAAGVPRTKIGMGLGFYGGGYTAPVTGPRQTISSYWGGDDNQGTWRDFYNAGMFSGSGVTYTFDEAAQAGYFTYSPPKTFGGRQLSMLITEDLQSIAAKGAWARAGNCGGTIVWTINYGYIPSLGRNLPMEAVKTAFLQGTAQRLSVSDAQVSEGHEGAKSLSFTVTLTAP